MKLTVTCTRPDGFVAQAVIDLCACCVISIDPPPGVVNPPPGVVNQPLDTANLNFRPT